MSEPVRLHRYIAQCGLCSRRKAEELILQHRVVVNGHLVSELGTKVSDADRVEVDGVVLKLQQSVTLLMNKPKGFLTTLSDPHNRTTVAQLIPDVGAALKPVGRLDVDTQGALLFTSDGELAARLTHARYGVEKEYEAVVEGLVDDKALAELRKGVFIEGRRTRPAQVELVRADPGRGTSKLTVILTEGRKRQVRLMCEAAGHPVLSLVRVRFAFLRVKGMGPGECRILGKQDVERLRSLVGL